MPACRKKTLKKSKFSGAKSGRKKKILIAPILILYYELSVCPLLLNYIKIYLVSSLIAKSNLGQANQLLRQIVKFGLTLTFNLQKLINSHL